MQRYALLRKVIYVAAGKKIDRVTFLSSRHRMRSGSVTVARDAGVNRRSTPMADEPSPPTRSDTAPLVSSSTPSGQQISFEPLPAFSPEQQQVLAQDLVKAGHLSPEQAAAALASKGITPLPPPLEPQIVAGGGDFSGAQLQVLAQDLVKAGKITLEQANKLLQAEGASPLQDPTAIDPEQAAFNKAFPPPNPADYQFPKMEDAEGDLSETAQELDTHTRAWMAHGRFPKEIGTALATDANDFAGKWAALDDATRETTKNIERGKLEKIWGSKAEEKIQQAKQFVAELDAKHPGLIKVLSVSGAGNCAAVVVHFAQQAERLAAMRSAGGKKK
jgi:polyhydroxyalkanoate synthesis regulator phasin